MSQRIPPVAIFAFNRPDLAGELARRVAEAQPPMVFLFVDGPRGGNVEDSEACRATRDALDSINWTSSVERFYSSTNRGLLTAVPDGLSAVFEVVDRAIVLEDDCHPDPTFFRFCGELLDRYQSDQRVGMVRGTSMTKLERQSYYFSRFTNIWGWATWADRWAHFDFDMREWPEARDRHWLRGELADPHAERVMTDAFDDAHTGSGLWDFKWQFASWKSGMAAATPGVNLVTNLGFGAHATTTKRTDSPLARRPVEPIEFPLVHPTEVRIDRAADRREFEWAFPRRTPRRQTFRGLRSLRRR